MHPKTTIMNIDQIADALLNYRFDNDLTIEQALTDVERAMHKLAEHDAAEAADVAPCGYSFGNVSDTRTHTATCGACAGVEDRVSKGY